MSSVLSLSHTLTREGAGDEDDDIEHVLLLYLKSHGTTLATGTESVEQNWFDLERDMCPRRYTWN